MTPEQRKNAIAAVVGVLAVMVVIYQVMFSGGPTPPQPTAAEIAAAAAGGAATPAVAAPAPAGATGAGPTRLTQVNVNIDELLKGVQEVTFDYESMRIDRDPLAALVGGPLKQDETGAVPLPGTGTEIRRKKITGILFDVNNPLAVVDDEVVGVGYTYPNGVKVYSIEKDKVTFQLGDALIEVEMKEL